jgi:hypothetical protein
MAQTASRPILILRNGPASGLDCSGISKAAPDIRFKSGPAAGLSYVLADREKVKAAEALTPPSRRRIALAALDRKSWDAVLSA